jgi:hypothetical protein
MSLTLIDYVLATCGLSPLQLVDRCPFVVCFMSALDKSCSLNQLVHYQHKLQQLQHHVLQGSTLAARDGMCACPGLVKVRNQRTNSALASWQAQHRSMNQLMLPWLTHNGIYVT